MFKLLFNHCKKWNCNEIEAARLAKSFMMQKNPIGACRVYFENLK
jgi:hypothetical protein